MPVLILKNGVPTGYAESPALFERIEVGINLFYTFRNDESAWIYARLLRCLRQYLHVSVFSVEPYQLGSHNQEAIEAGAFWFYRKLGFHAVQPQVARMVAREERKLANRLGIALLRASCVNSPRGICSTKRPQFRIPAIGTISVFRTSGWPFSSDRFGSSAAANENSARRL